MSKIEREPNEPSQKVEGEYGWLYWFLKHIIDDVLGFIGRHVRVFRIVGIVVVILLFICRAWWQPLMLNVRVHSAECLLILGLFFIWRYMKRRNKTLLSWSLIIVFVGLVWFGYKYKITPHQYLTLYRQYTELNLREIDELPETDYERIQPINSIRDAAGEVMSIVEQASEPHLVRVGDQYRFTFAIEPSYHWSKLTGNVRELISIPSTAPSLNFSSENRVAVKFAVSENLYLGKNTKISVIRNFGPWKFLSYKPVDVRYIPDDSGKMVQLVTLMRYRGIFFPKPEFGGVYVIRQNEGGFLHFIKSLFCGDGEWIRPENISKHEYLKKQNLLPYEVSRYVAESFRFQNGFASPLPGYHRGDIRIPDTPDDNDNQPFTIFFRFSGENPEGENKLYHYFALEPFDPTKHGLNTSVLVPADGIGKILVCKHFEKSSALIGVSVVEAKVRASQKMYDWNNNSIAEQRPYIKRIDGQLRFFWLSTVVAKKLDGKGVQYVAGSIPQITLTEAQCQQPVWVESTKPNTWLTKIHEDLDSVWNIPKKSD